MFYCFDKDLKKILWSHSLTEEYGRVSGYGGRLASPIVDGDLVIVSMLNGSWGEMAIGGNRFVAFDKKHRRRGLVGQHRHPRHRHLLFHARRGRHQRRAAAHQRRLRRRLRLQDPHRRDGLGLRDLPRGRQPHAGRGRQPRLHRPRRGERQQHPGQRRLPRRLPGRERQAQAGLARGRHQGQVRLAGRPRRQGLHPQRRGRPLLPGRQDRQPEVVLRLRHGNQRLAGAGRRQNLCCGGRIPPSTS